MIRSDFLAESSNVVNIKNMLCYFRCFSVGGVKVDELNFNEPFSQMIYLVDIISFKVVMCSFLNNDNQLIRFFFFWFGSKRKEGWIFFSLVCVYVCMSLCVCVCVCGGEKKIANFTMTESKCVVQCRVVYIVRKTFRFPFCDFLHIILSHASVAPSLRANFSLTLLFFFLPPIVVEVAIFP